jgi:hypothetical protein
MLLVSDSQLPDRLQVRLAAQATAVLPQLILQLEGLGPENHAIAQN